MRLAERYGHFYAPSMVIEIEGQDIRKEGLVATSLSIDQITDGAAKFGFTLPGLQGSPGSLSTKRELFSFGQSVAIYLGYGSRLFLMLEGLITTVSYSFTVDSPPEIRVEGFDLLFPMMRLRLAAKEKKHRWPRATDSEVAKEIASRYFRQTEITDTRIRHPQIVQREEESDFQFLKRLAERNGFEIFCRIDQEGQRSVFRFAPPRLETLGHDRPDLRLSFGQDLLSFTPTIKMNQVVSQVIVRGWDPKSKKEIEARAPKTTPRRPRGKTSGPQTALKALKEPVTLEVRLPVFSREEAQARAEALLLKASEGLVEGEGESVGIPELVPGKVLKIQGLGPEFTGPFYVYQTTHSFGSNGYRTTFRIKEASFYAP